MAALLAVVILLPSVTWALTPAPTRDWWWAAWQDTAESYAAYADKYRDTDSPHLQKALLRKAWRSGRVQDYRRYLSTFGANAQYRSQVLDSLNVLEDRRLKLFLQHPDSSALHRYLADFPENERLDKLEQAAVNLAPGSARTAILSAIAAKRGNTGGPGTPGRDSIPANTALPDSDTTAFLPDRRTGDAQGPGILPQRPGVIVPAKSDPFGFEMVLVKGGTFTMGQSDPNIFCEGCSGNECPHEVTVRTFSIGKYEVTQKQWKQVMGANPSYFNTCDDCPVEQVSWQDVQRFLAAVNAKLPAGQKKYRLPTEAEWEFAARGGNRSKNFACSGSNDPAKVAWFDKNAAGKTHPVGKLAANELGLYDMSGNVYEWCADVWKPYSCDSKTAPNRSNRVTRGGSWRFYGNMCRSTIRDSYSAAHNKEVIGFRLAR
ncbi:MAG: formylglycine-generating enzyme family protein [Lewinellaceae bacterium]|nr:formylglycine-generating enzyme family protein [Lewinellaceae bacterium]